MNKYIFEYSDSFFAKKMGSAKLNEDSIQFILDTKDLLIQFAEIISYEVLYYRGVTLRFKFRNGNKFKLKALDSFCDPTQFEEFCKHLEESLSQYALNSNTGLIRKPSIFEHKLIPWFLAIGTMIIIWVFIRNIRANYSIINVLVPASILISLWIAYFISRSKLKNQDI